jgi:ribosomal protein S18 acetylase RimI-like enzyme
MDPRIRSLTAADAAIFQSLRLDALARCPAAFSAAHEEELAQSFDDVQARLVENTVFGAFVDGELCGMAGFRRPFQVKKRHKGTLWGVYVRPGIRREGLGTALVAAVIEHARGEVAQLQAAVVTSNHSARRLYRRLGFVVYGLEPGGLRVDGDDLDQELLVLHFATGGTRPAAVALPG